MWRQFNVAGAVLLGVLLPLLETLRRGFAHWQVNFTTMFEDYAAGIALLAAAWAQWRRLAWAGAWMLISWSGITFMMLISTVSQVERTLRGDLEPHAGWVLFIKILLLMACVAALAHSVRQLGPGRR